MGHQVTWRDLVFAIAMSAFGFYMALTTKAHRIPEDPADLGYNLKMYAKWGGWVFAIGGLLVALRILSMLNAQQ